MSECRVESILICLNQVAKFQKYTPGKLYFNDFMIPVHEKDKVKTTGFINILFLFTQNNKLLLGNDSKDEAEILLWLDYAKLYAVYFTNVHNKRQILDELDSVLTTRSYFVSFQITLADIVLYYILHEVFISLTHVEKETYLHVSRWFDNIQQDSNIRQSNEIVSFSTNYLSSFLPVKN